MEGSNTVYTEGAVDGKPSHSYHSVADDGHAAVLFIVTWISLSQVDKEATVDFFYNLIDAGKQSLENVDGPLFQGLCQDGVVGIGKGLDDNVPGILPAEAVIVHKDTHQLRDGHYRMGSCCC